MALHIRQVHDAERFRCKECGSQFTRQEKLNAHLKRGHKRRLPSPLPNIPTKRVRPAMPPASPLPPEDPIEPPSDAHPLIRREWAKIRTHYLPNLKFESRYNFRMPEYSNEYVKKCIRSVFETQKVQGKWNIWLGSVLRNYVTDELYYYYPSHNTDVFEMPVLVYNESCLEFLYRKIDELDLEEVAKFERPNTSFVLDSLTNFVVVVYKLVGHPMG